MIVGNNVGWQWLTLINMSCFNVLETKGYRASEVTVGSNTNSCMCFFLFFVFFFFFVVFFFFCCCCSFVS